MIDTPQTLADALNPQTHGASVLLRYLPEGPLVGAEVGVLRGVNAMALLQARPKLLLWCVDNWQVYGVEESPAEIRRQAKALLAEGAVTSIRSRVIWQEMHSFAAATHHANESLDFVYLDSDHSAEHLSIEIAMWFPAIKPGGILAGHDYGHPDYPGVKEVVNAQGWADLIVEDRTWIHHSL